MANIQIKTMMTSTPDVIGYKTGATTFVVICPFCHRQHTHGGDAGYRAPDCGLGYEYQIVELKPYEKSNLKNREKSRTK